MQDIKITVIKRTISKDLINEYVKEKYQDIKPCERLKDGQEFLVTKESSYISPEDFCEWTWADIRHNILALAFGGKIPHMKNENENIVVCTDWCRPVYFKIERID